MKKIVFLLVVFFASTILLQNLVLGEIIINKPADLYNYGDYYDAEIILKEPVGTSQPFYIDLSCENGRKNLMKISQFWIKNKEEKISHTIFFSKPFLGDLSGKCKVIVGFGNEMKESPGFIISDKINVELEISNMTCDPSELVTIKGKAVKENGKNVNGVVEIWLKANESVMIGNGIVEEGKFSVSAEMPGNIPARIYNVKVSVYETQNNEISNHGEAFMKIKIKQKPTKIDIVLPKQNFLPGENITFTTTIYDQAGEKVSGEISLKIYDSHDNLVYEKIIESGSQETYGLGINSSFGYWKIKASFDELQEERSFFVEKVEKANFSFENNFIIIENIGNTLYNKSVQIKVDDYVKVINIELGIGEKAKIRVGAPSGYHNISVSDGSSFFEIKNIHFSGFTGYSVKIVKEKEDYSIAYWILSFIVIITIIFISLKKKKSESHREAEKIKFVGNSEKQQIALPSKGGVVIAKINKDTKEKKKEYIEIDKGKIAKEAKRVAVVKGIKEEVVFLTIKIENFDKIRSAIKETIERVKEEIIKRKGSIYETQEYIIGIYTSLNTKTLGNEKEAIESAEKIMEIFEKHNRLYKEKIDFGISIVRGPAVVKKREKLEFVPLSNVLNKARKIADIAKNELLISEDVYRKEMSNLKAIKKVLEGIEVYSVERSLKKEEYSKFINDFLRRNKEFFEKEKNN